MGRPKRSFFFSLFFPFGLQGPLNECPVRQMEVCLKQEEEDLSLILRCIKTSSEASQQCLQIFWIIGFGLWMCDCLGCSRCPGSHGFLSHGIHSSRFGKWEIHPFLVSSQEPLIQTEGRSIREFPTEASPKDVRETKQEG